MKRYLMLILTTALILGGCNKNKFVVSGTISDAENQTLTFTRVDLEGDIILDSLKLSKSGNFKFKHKSLGTPTFFKLGLSANKYITIIGDSAEHIVIKSNSETFSSGYIVENSKPSLEIKNQNIRLSQLQYKVDSLINYYNNLPVSEKHLQIENINKNLLNNINLYKKVTGEFILENPRSFVSYYTLFLTFSDGTQVMDVMNKEDQVYFSALATSLNLFYPESQRVKQLYNIVLSAKAEERRLKIIDIINNAEGSDMPDLKIEDKNGDIQSLKSLKGKVVLLSFWASWDEASVKENTNLKNIYKKYNPKGFEVYQIGLERSKVLWENAILSTQIPWISVTELKYTDSPAARMYNIQQIPSNYLISREGEIIGKNLFGRRLEEKLKEIL